MNQYENVKYNDNGNNLEIKISLEKRIAYLTQKDIASLFNMSVSNINKHISKIIKENESVISTIEEYSTVQFENGRKINRQVKLYPLYLVLIIGHRVHSNKAEQISNFVSIIFNKTKINNTQNNEIIIYDNGVVHIPFKISRKEQTIWSNELQMSEIFETTRQNINHHINSIFEDEELDVESVRKKYLHTGADGKQQSIQL